MVNHNERQLALDAPVAVEGLIAGKHTPATMFVGLKTVYTDGSHDVELLVKAKNAPYDAIFCAVRSRRRMMATANVTARQFEAGAYTPRVFSYAADRSAAIAEATVLAYIGAVVGL